MHEMRTNTMALFDYSTFDVVQFLLQARMSFTCGYPMQHFETPMVLHYTVGGVNVLELPAVETSRPVADWPETIAGEPPLRRATGPQGRDPRLLGVEAEGLAYPRPPGAGSGMSRGWGGLWPALAFSREPY